MERDAAHDTSGDVGGGDLGDDDVADAQELVASWGDEVEAKGLTDDQWQSMVEVRSRDTDESE